MFSPLYSVFSALLLALNLSVTAAPVKFLAFAPTIITPNSSTVWTSGNSGSVSWVTNDVPTEAQNYTLTILLGRLNNGSENLDITNPLATRVPIMQGSVTVPVPANLTYATDYVVAVIGDSGDISSCFTIVPASNASVALH
ncbi:hypothetical protein J3R82DRAFT_9682 [Butyriboletus roseoflavus]|nr:hypothetical protein J3R82DRAFT_9682 [Butyriboletus roseoflavus]